MVELFGQPTIDWRLPPAFQGSCTESGVDPDHLEQLLGSPDSCFTVYSAMFPQMLFDTLRDVEQMPRPAKETLKLLESHLDPVYTVGCAANFLFSFTGAYAELKQSTQLLLSRRRTELPEQYVAVHLRFGDGMFNGSNAKPDKMIVLRALQCAAELGRGLLGLGSDWAILFASDSLEARQLALAHGFGETMPLVFESHWRPAHMDQRTNWVGEEQDAAARLWGSLADHLLLVRARGLVQCFSHDPPCGVVNGKLHSGFSLVAAQEGMLPAENFRLATSADVCSKEDLAIV